MYTEGGEGEVEATGRKPEGDDAGRRIVAAEIAGRKVVRAADPRSREGASRVSFPLPPAPSSHEGRGRQGKESKVIITKVDRIVRFTVAIKFEEFSNTFSNTTFITGWGGMGHGL